MEVKYTGQDHTFAICAYGDSPYLEECIASLKKQTVPSRIILCAAESSDYLNGIAVRNEIPLRVRGGAPEIARDWNYALRSSASPLVTLAHQDDRYEPEFLEKTLKAFSRAERPLLSFTDYYEIRGTDRIDSGESRKLRIKERMLFPLRTDALKRSRLLRRLILSFGSPICCPSVTYVKPNLPKRVFRSGFQSDLDWETWERISRRRGSFCYIPEILMGHRIHAASATTRVIGSARNRSGEDLEMLERFWPKRAASVINRFYMHAQDDNDRL